MTEKSIKKFIYAVKLTLIIRDFLKVLCVLLRAFWIGLRLRRKPRCNRYSVYRPALPKRS
jgi:hypothetical protein